MKKIIALIMFVILSIAVVSQSPANSEIKELNSFQNDYGAETRFSQLKDSITRNIEQGELIIEKILEENSEADITRLNQILAEYDNLISDIEQIDYEQSIEDLINQYLDVKAQAKELSAEFKEIAKDYLSEELRLELKNQFQDMNKISSQVKNMINLYNSEQAKKIMNMFGKDDDLSKKIQNSQMSKNQIMDELRLQYKGLGAEKQNQAIFMIQEQNAVVQVASNQYMQQFQQKNQIEQGKLDSEKAQQGSNEDNQGQGNQDTNMNQGESDNGSDNGNKDSGSENSGSGSSGQNSGNSNSGSSNSGSSTGGTVGGKGGSK